MCAPENDQTNAPVRPTELTRLLGTAKDEERKEVIRKAIAVLDSAQAGNGMAVSVLLRNLFICSPPFVRNK